jgi:Tfp pilus tip-associated adhesin PilY1
MIHAGMDTTRVIGSRCDMRDPNDVSHNFLTGYAFIANDASSLALALKKVLREIAGQREKAFSSAEVTSIEEDYTATEYEARMYLASFYPDADPFWEGHLRSVRLVPGGLSFENIPDSLLIWDAGDLLRDRNPDTRNIYGIKGGSIQELNSSNFNATDFAVGSSAEAEEIVNLVRCGNSLDDSIAYLGDIFHSSPLRVGYPSYWYSDDGFAQYRDNMISRDPLIYAGSNTGLIHAFYDETGEEAFAVVPENFVPEIKALADSHRFYVDADPMAADVWFPSEASDTFKDADEWKTVLMACQGEGGRGITCLDVTNPASLPPGHLFSIYDTAAMGYTTSVPVMFKVAKEVGTDTVERFFAFFGGGEWPESMYNIYSPGSEVRGNVIVAVDIYGAYTSGLSGSNYLFIPAASGDESKMVYPFASAASVVNLNSRWDNLYDLLYIPDLAGQLWKVDLRDPDISSWRARCIFQPPIPADTTQDSLWQPAFFAPLVEREPATGCLWLFYGTGNRSMVFKENTDNRFYAILDTLTDTTNYPLTEDNLKRVWTEGPFDFPSEFPDYRGWYIVYSDSSTHVDEKTVSQASLFLDTLKFVTFEPTEFSSDCNIGTGGAREYSYHFRTGSGRFKNMGGGIPQAPRYSFDQSGSGYEIHQTSDSLWVEQKTGFGTLKRILQWKER